MGQEKRKKTFEGFSRPFRECRKLHVLFLWNYQPVCAPFNIRARKINYCIHRVCSVSKDSTIRLWELDSGKELYCQFLSGFGPLTDLISPEKEM